MTPQLRNFYKLEKRWKDAEVYEFSSYLGKLHEAGIEECNKNNLDGLNGNESSEPHEDIVSGDDDNGDNGEIDVFWT